MDGMAPVQPAVLPEGEFKMAPAASPPPVVTWPRAGYLVLFKETVDSAPAAGALAIMQNCNGEGIGDLVIFRPRGGQEYKRGVHHVGDPWFRQFEENKTRGCWDWHPSFPKFLYEMAHGIGGDVAAGESASAGPADFKKLLVEAIGSDEGFKKAIKAALK